eukprot:scaffold34613_cov166-Amphora_coffeaeformis.AAC.5
MRFEGSPYDVSHEHTGVNQGTTRAMDTNRVDHAGIVVMQKAFSKIWYKTALFDHPHHDSTDTKFQTF